MNTSHFVTSEIIQHVVDTIGYAVHPHKILVFGSCAEKKIKWDSDIANATVLRCGCSNRYR